jgi:glycosyltransferase involved in cell wall biosynthesis
VRLAVYCDYSYRVHGGELYAELPFGLFLRELARHCDRLVVTGRLDPTPGAFPFRMTDVGYAPLPYYASGSHLLAVLRALPIGIARFWRVLADVDTVWILGPNPPQVFMFALLARLRRRRLVLGVRQRLPELIRHRYPGNRRLSVLAVVLEGAFRALAVVTPVVVVGPDLALRYRRARAVHETYISLLGSEAVAAPQDDSRSYDGPQLRMLAVGRLDPEKNPLLLADVLAAAREQDPRWQLDICGEGTQRQALIDRLSALGVADQAHFHGYVPIDDGLRDLYRNSHALLHVSFTEGVPQVLLEAFAARLPVVATDVGGVGALVDGGGLLVPVNDAQAAAAALNRLAADEALRAELITRGVAIACEHTLEAECAHLAAFLAARGG